MQCNEALRLSERPKHFYQHGVSETMCAGAYQHEFSTLSYVRCGDSEQHQRTGSWRSYPSLLFNRFSCLQVLSTYKKHSQPPVSLIGQLLWREFFYQVGNSTVNFDRMEGNPICKQARARGII